MEIILLFIVVFFINVYGIYYNLQFKNNTLNRFVLFILLVVFLHIVIGLLIRISFPAVINLFLAFPFSLIFGPVVLLIYNQYREGKWPQNYYLHFVPFVLLVCCFMVLTYNAPWRYLYYDQFFITSNILSVIIYLSYLLWIALRLDCHQELTWLQFLNVSKKVVIFSFITLVFLFSMVIFNIEVGSFSEYQFFNLFFLFFFLSRVLHFSILKETPAITASTESLDDVKEDQVPIKQSNTVERAPIELPKEIEDLYRQKIDVFILTKGYLDIDLNREQFCEQLGIKKNYLGPFLKKHYKKNFNGFVNQLRLHYAGKLLRQEELLYTIDDLSFVCGFNSRASFYRNFISEFGCPPHEYRAKMQQSLKLQA